MSKSIQIIRLKEVLNFTGDKRSTFYLRIKQGLMPKQISLGGTSVGWLKSEIDTVLAARIKGATDSDIKILVQELTKNRHQVVF